MSQTKRSRRRVSKRNPLPNLVGVDLFCGAGGLTRGLELAGIRMAVGIDADPNCEYPYSANNGASFWHEEIENVSGNELSKEFGSAKIRLIAGCAPCQPFSTYSRAWSNSADARWNLLKHFKRLVGEVDPEIVTMENVPLLRREEVFSSFVKSLKRKGFYVSHQVVNCVDYGVPQMRRRLVLLASRLGAIELVPPRMSSNHRITVREHIGHLPPPADERTRSKDPLHRASNLSPLNLRRIRASKPGGTWRDWKKDLRAGCHAKKSGQTYGSVYGRMDWDQPSPTITTQFYGYGNGRFGHPKQDRAISLREGAILQSFPKKYKFVQPGQSYSRSTLGRLIGNAVPVKLGQVIGGSIVRHVRDCLEAEE